MAQNRPRVDLLAGTPKKVALAMAVEQVPGSSRVFDTEFNTLFSDV